MKGNEQLYEQRYQQCREQGLTGWFNGETLDAILSRLMERMAAPYLPKAGRILELGCGAGDQALRLAEAGYDVTGVDIAPTAILWAKEKAGQRGVKASFQVGNVCDLNDFSDHVFDLALDGYCLHFVLESDRQKFLRSVHRVLKPGGWLLVTSICFDPNETITLPDYDAATRCYAQNGIPYTYQGLAEDICQEIQQAGFEIVWREISPAVPGVQSAVLRLDARKIE